MERYIEEEQDYPNPPVMQFEGGLCVDVGEAWFIKWCPRGGWIDQADCTSVS